MAIDFFNPETNPLPVLPFETPQNYIPAAPSLMKNLEDSIVRAVDALPVVSERIAAAATRVDSILKHLEEAGIANKAVETFDNVNNALVEMRAAVKNIDDAKVAAKAAKTLDKVDGAVVRLDKVLQRIDGDQGLVASATRATDSFTEVGRSFAEVGRGASGSTRELDATLGEVREAAAAIRELAESLERDPDMLLKGRSPGGSP